MLFRSPRRARQPRIEALVHPGDHRRDLLRALAQQADDLAFALAAVDKLIALLPPERKPSPIDTALDRAVITAPEARDPALLARLDAVAGRYLGKDILPRP